MKPVRKIPWNKGLTKETDKRVAQPWLGKKRSLETRIKLSIANKGFRHSEETKKKISIGLTGRPVSNETRKKIANAMHRIGRPEHMKGPNSPRWKGKNRRSIRQIVLDRDKYRCQKCGGFANEADHIIPVKDAPERFADFSNLQALCKKCHRKKTNLEISKSSCTP